ncbi:MAG: flagellar biosynthesis anti-sigma factor FlgM [Oligoflexia bacterium]|nr:flagellar biosynthesis anti-sigma factor FlgM [Oligoflexia bacterium]
MKVTDKNLAEPMDGLTKTRGTQKKSQASSTGKSQKPEMVSTAGELTSARVKLSDRAQDMKKIREQVDKTPDVDDAKVAKFKNLIAQGKYKVDSNKVADKMVDEHVYTDLLATKDE